MPKIRAALTAVTFLAGCVLTVPAFAIPTTAKSFDQLVGEVMAFLLSDVGIGGIRTEDATPGGSPVPPYFYHYSIRHDDVLWSATSGYPGYASISYPGYTAAVAIDAFLAWWAYSGDTEGLARARELADWLIARRTPATDFYGNWVYSTQTDGVMGGGYDGDAIMSDKSAMFALRCLQLHEITGHQPYLDAAYEIAITYRDTQQPSGRWPFRVRPSDGLIRQDYTSHLIPMVRLLERMDALYPGEGFAVSAAAAWLWLESNPLEPTSPNFQNWAGFYEDIDAIDSLGLLDHYGAENTLDGLLHRDAPGDRELAISIFDWSTTRYLAPDTAQNGWGTYDFAILEWDAWPNTTYAATGQWAYSALRLDQVTQGTALHDPTWKPNALRALNNLTYGQGLEPLPADGRMLTTIRELSHPLFGLDTWYEQNFNTVKYVLACMDLAPELAPDDEDHLLGFDGGELQEIADTGPRVLTTWSQSGVARFRLVDLPLSVRFASGWQAAPSSNTPGWSWDPTLGVLEVRHDGGQVEIAKSGAVSVPAREVSQLGNPTPNPFNPSVTIPLTLATESQVQVTILDSRGRTVRSWSPRSLPPGTTTLNWNGRDDNGHPAPSAVYHLQVTIDNHPHTKRITLLR